MRIDRSLGLFVVMGVLGVAVAACSDNGGGGGPITDMDAGMGLCQGESPHPACDDECTTDGNCPSGFHCAGDGTCNAQCSPDTGGCPATHTCDTSVGRCNPVSGPCASDTPPEGCERDCTRHPDCPFGLLCLGSICTAECDPRTHEGCRSNELCQPTGFCAPGQRPSDAGTEDGCEPTNVTAEPSTPTVVLIIDQSGSMNARFPPDGNPACSQGGSTSCPSRWRAVREVLFNSSNGVVTQLDGVARFGMVMYSSDSSGDNPACGEGSGDCNCPADVVDASCSLDDPFDCRCLLITEEAPDLGNRNSLLTTFGNGNDWLEDTPTGESVAWTTSWLRTFPEVADSGTMTWNGEPIVYVLLTDGEPDSCCNADPGTGSGSCPAEYLCDPTDTVADRQWAQDISVEAVGRANMQGIPTHVIRVAANSSHFNDLAAAGGTGTAVPADSPAQLETELRSIITGTLSCTIPLNGTIENPNEVCDDGSVTLNGSPITCLGECSSPTGSDGWCVVNPSTIQLQGTACATAQSGMDVSVTATFACGGFIGM